MDPILINLGGIDLRITGWHDRLFATDSERPYDLVRTLPPGSLKTQHYMDPDAPRALWINAIEVDGTHRIVEVRNQDGTGLHADILIPLTINLMRRFFDCHRLTLQPKPRTKMRHPGDVV